METTSKKWFYEINSERKGPVDETQIEKLIKDGTIGYGTKVWTDGFPEWLKIENTDLKKFLETVPPPVNPQKSKSKPSNVSAWFLAFGPIIGYIVEYMYTYMQNTGYGEDLAESITNLQMSGHLYWWVPFLVNTILLLWDYGTVKKAGANAKELAKFIVIIPVYLYKRAQMFGDNLAYFIVWIVAFVISLIS